MAPARAAYGEAMSAESTRARVEDIHEVALGPAVRDGQPRPSGNPVYQVGVKSFVFFRTARPDATDPITGERYPDVIVVWVASESDKQALVTDPSTPFFKTPQVSGHNSVLLRASRVGELTRQELTEILQDAWLAQASNRRGTAWLAA